VPVLYDDVIEEFILAEWASLSRHSWLFIKDLDELARQDLSV